MDLVVFLMKRDHVIVDLGFASSSEAARESGWWESWAYVQFECREPSFLFSVAIEWDEVLFSIY